MMHVVREATLYSVASAVAFLVDVGLLTALVEWAGWHYLAAASVAFLGGTCVVYVASVTAIFTHRRLSDSHFEFGLFAAIGALGLLVNLLVLKLAVDVVGVHYLVGKIASAAFTFALNFGLRRWLLFSAPSAGGCSMASKGLGE